jgi:hypothetical protein
VVQVDVNVMGITPVTDEHHFCEIRDGDRRGNDVKPCQFTIQGLTPLYSALPGDSAKNFYT